MSEVIPSQILDSFEYFPETGLLIRDGKPTGYIMKSGYRLLCIKKKRIYAHRFIWYLVNKQWPEKEIDHINGLKDDNRWANLRLATRQENSRNQKVTKKNTSGYKGVSFYAQTNKWRAVIELGYGHKHLGYFDTKEEASEKYNKEADKNFGAFANYDKNTTN